MSSQPPKKRLLIFHPALAPYRIDQFNALHEIFDLHIIFLFENVYNQSFDQSVLRSKLRCSYDYLLIGPQCKERVFRFGILNAIKTFKPDIVVGYEYSFTTQYLILLKRLGFIKQILGTTIDDSPQICQNVQSWLRKIARGYSLKYLDFISVLSIDVANFYQKTFSLDPKNVFVAPILQQPDSLREDSDVLLKLAKEYCTQFCLESHKIILFVGRLAEEKGLAGFIEKSSDLLKSDDELRFVVIGDGPQQKELQGLVKSLKLDKQILFLGRYESKALHAWYVLASGFVLPSVYEPFGAVVNEALVFGVPVLISKYAGSKCLITPNNGLIFDPLDVDDTGNQFSAFVASLQDDLTVNITLRPSLMQSDQKTVDDWISLIN